MDNLGNQNNENNGAKSGKSFGDLLRALNDFQDSLGELMDDNKLCEFKFTKGIIAYGAGYHIGIPDGFKINRESKNANGDRRDFLAWLPDEFEKKDFMIGEADEDKPVVAGGNDSRLRSFVLCGFSECDIVAAVPYAYHQGVGSHHVEAFHFQLGIEWRQLASSYLDVA